MNRIPRKERRALTRFVLVLVILASGCGYCLGLIAWLVRPILPIHAAP